MNPQTTTRLAIIFGVIALLLSIVAMIVKFTRGHGIDWTHLIAVLGLLFFLIVVTKTRGHR